MPPVPAVPPAAPVPAVPLVPADTSRGEPHEELMSGGNSTVVVRVGDTVRRAAGPWTPTVQQLLARLSAAGFRRSPVALGMDERGREVVSYLPGAVAHHPPPAFVHVDAN